MTFHLTFDIDLCENKSVNWALNTEQRMFELLNRELIWKFHIFLREWMQHNPILCALDREAAILVSFWFNFVFFFLRNRRIKWNAKINKLCSKIYRKKNVSVKKKENRKKNKRIWNLLLWSKCVPNPKISYSVAQLTIESWRLCVKCSIFYLFSSKFNLKFSFFHFVCGCLVPHFNRFVGLFRFGWPLKSNWINYS